MSTIKLIVVLVAGAAAGAGFTWAVLDGRVANRSPAAPSEAVSGVLRTADQTPLQEDGYLDARTKGSADAPITIFEASDFQCPFCRDFWEQTLPALDSEYIKTGKVRLVFLNFPLTSLHPNAAAAHEFAMCAAVQGRFWEMHDLLFRHQTAWASLSQPSSYFRLLLDSVDVSRATMEECLATGQVRPIVVAEGQSMFRSGLQSTPSFVIEGGLLPGAQPIEVWRPILDSLIAAKRR